MPAHMSFVDRLDVSPPKSPLSRHATDIPRDAASRALPVPVAPPPITTTSYCLSLEDLPSLLNISEREGNPLGPGTVDVEWVGCPVMSRPPALAELAAEVVEDRKVRRGSAAGCGHEETDIWTNRRPRIIDTRLWDTIRRRIYQRAAEKEEEFANHL